MNKQAIDPQLLHTLIASLALGGGSFAGIKLLQEAAKNIQGGHGASGAKDLGVELPGHMAPGYESQMHQQQGQQPQQDPHKQASVTESLMTGGTALAGGAAGFLGAKYLYDTVKGKQLDDKLDLSKKQYKKQLADFDKPDEKHEVTKTSSATPLVDAFCEKFAAEANGLSSELMDMLQKAALFEAFRNSTPEELQAVTEAPSGMDWAKGLVGLHNPNYEAFANRANHELETQGAKNVLGGATGGHYSALMKALGLTVGASALYTGKQLYDANKKKEKAHDSRTFPNSVQVGYDPK